MDSRDIRDVQGIPTTSAELLILQLAARRRSPDYVEMLIHAARRKRLITYESALSTFNRHAGRGVAGTRAVRIALERWDPTQPPSDSEMETMLLQALRAHGLPHPVIQFEVRDMFGNFVRRADAAYPDAHLAIEYDSKQEHSNELQLDRDNRRRNALAKVGYRTIAARHRDLKSGGSEICELIAAALKTCVPA